MAQGILTVWGKDERESFKGHAEAQSSDGALRQWEQVVVRWGRESSGQRTEWSIVLGAVQFVVPTLRIVCPSLSVPIGVDFRCQRRGVREDGVSSGGVAQICREAGDWGSTNEMCELDTSQKFEWKGSDVLTEWFRLPLLQSNSGPERPRKLL